jgi:hypothetical protein
MNKSRFCDSFQTFTAESMVIFFERNIFELAGVFCVDRGEYLMLNMGLTGEVWVGSGDFVLLSIRAPSL